ncbi:MAG TPA: hypothetical protein VG817_08550 [Gemmatimonadales bacterium]|nr:hypothetical protein [Gemmatimonadales bacterium]
MAKHLILPPTDPPKELRGELVEVTFYILADGTVDRVSIKPEIKDRKFAKRLDETMRGYRFTPATNASGVPVPSVYTQTMRY